MINRKGFPLWHRRSSNLNLSTKQQKGARLEKLAANCLQPALPWVNLQWLFVPIDDQLSMIEALL
jgi:hypothetical protein